MKATVHTYHNRMNSTYPGTGQHCVDQLWDHGKVDGHPVSLFHTLIKETKFSVAINIRAKIYHLRNGDIFPAQFQKGQCSFKVSMLDAGQIL